MTRYPDIQIRKVLIHEAIDGKTDQFITTSPFVYLHPLVGERIVPAGFVTDGLSVPQIFWALVPPHGLGFNAAVVHDDCYVNVVGSEQWGDRLAREVADALFRDNCLALGMPKWQAELVFNAVRAGGAGSWRKYRERMNAQPKKRLKSLYA